MSEFGAENPYGRHGAQDERWTEEYQSNLYQHQITMLKKFLRWRACHHGF